MSRVSAIASSSACSSMRSARRCMSCCRFSKPILGQGPWSKASRAAATARSASATPPHAMVAHCSRVYGSMSGMVAPSTEGTSSLLMMCPKNSNPSTCMIPLSQVAVPMLPRRTLVLAGPSPPGERSRQVGAGRMKEGILGDPHRRGLPAWPTGDLGLSDGGLERAPRGLDCGLETLGGGAHRGTLSLPCRRDGLAVRRVGGFARFAAGRGG